MRKESRTDQANKLDLDACVFKSPAIFGTDSDCTLHRFAIHVEWCLLPPVLVQLDIDSLPVVGFLKHDVDVDWSREEVGGHGGDRRAWTRSDRPLRTPNVLQERVATGQQRRGRSFVVEPMPLTLSPVSSVHWHLAASSP